MICLYRMMNLIKWTGKFGNKEVDKILEADCNHYEYMFSYMREFGKEFGNEFGKEYEKD